MFGQAAAWRTALEIPREDASAYTSAMQARWSRHGLAPPPETWGRGWMESACKHSSPTSLNNGIGGGGVISGDLHLWFHVPPFFYVEDVYGLGDLPLVGSFLGSLLETIHDSAGQLLCFMWVPDLGNILGFLGFQASGSLALCLVVASN